MEVVILASKKYSITLDPAVYDEFCRYAGKHGIKVSTWIGIQMQNFIEEQKEIEGIRKSRRERELK